MKNLLIFIVCFTCHFVSVAQCAKEIHEQQLQEKMFFLCQPIDNVAKTYVAEITEVSSDAFSCRFLHSQSTYKFKGPEMRSIDSASYMNATVKSNVGGSYPEGTIFTGNFYMADPDDCDLSSVEMDDPYFVIATFHDGKRYLGMLLLADNGYWIRFAHTNSVYNTDENFKVLSTQGGGYAIGSQMKVVHARRLNF